MDIGDTVMLTGDNDRTPNFGLKGKVVNRSPSGYVCVHWDDGTRCWYSPWQAMHWIVRLTGPGVR